MEMQLHDAERKRARLIASCLVFALISIPLILKNRSADRHLRLQNRALAARSTFFVARPIAVPIMARHPISHYRVASLGSFLCP